MSIYLKKLAEFVAHLETSQEVESFLTALFTPKELAEIPKRLEIIEQILQGKSHHKIAADLAVGVATVTRGSKELQKGGFEKFKSKFKQESLRDE